MNPDLREIIEDDAKRERYDEAHPQCEHRHLRAHGISVYNGQHVMDIECRDCDRRTWLTLDAPTKAAIMEFLEDTDILDWSE